MQRLRHRPDHFMHRGNRMAFHRFQDGATLARLDPYADGEQIWLLHSGRDIAVTAEEVRDISKQVHGLDLPATRPEGGSCNCGARFAAIEARLDALEAAASRADENETLRARIAELEKAALDAALTASLASNPELYPPAQVDPVGGLEGVPEPLRGFSLEGETADKFTERMRRRYRYLKHMQMDASKPTSARALPEMNDEEQDEMRALQARGAEAIAWLERE